MTKKYPNIQSRLVFGMLVLLILPLFISIYYMNDVQQLNRTIDEVIKHPYTVSNNIRDINIYINAMHRSMKDVTLAENEIQLKDAIAQVNNHEKLVYEKFEIVSERFLGNPSDIEIAHEAFMNWKPIRDKVIHFVQQNNLEKAAAITKNEGATYVKMLMNKTQTLIAFADSKTNEYFMHSLTIQKNAKRKTYLLIISSFVFGLITFLWIIRSVNRPLEKIINKIKRIPPEQFINKFPENEKNNLALLDFVFHELEDQNKYFEGQVIERTKELAEAQSFLRKSIENASIGMVTIDLKGYFINVNQAFCKFTGYSKDELLKMKFNDITPERDKNRGLEFIEKILGGEIIDEPLEKSYIHNSGKIIQGSVTVSLVRDNNNKAINFFNQITDITKQKKYEHELIKHKKELEYVIENRTVELEAKTNKLVKSQKALTYLLEDVNESQEKMSLLNSQIIEANEELERMNKLFVGRELKMVELKEKIKLLTTEL